MWVCVGAVRPGRARVRSKASGRGVPPGPFLSGPRAVEGEAWVSGAGVCRGQARVPGGKGLQGGKGLWLYAGWGPGEGWGRGWAGGKRLACQEWDSNPRLQGRLRPERSALDRSAILTAGRSASPLGWLRPDAPPSAAPLGGRGAPRRAGVWVSGGRAHAGRRGAKLSPPRSPCRAALAPHPAGLWRRPPPAPLPSPGP